MTDVLVMIVLGLIVGAVAKLVMPGDDPGGIVITILLGIAGAVVGGYLSRAVGIEHAGEFGQFVIAVLGAMVLLFAYRLLNRARA